MGSSRERGFSVTSERLAFIEQKMREMGIDSREALAEAAKLSPDVIQKKLFSGRNVDRSTVEAIAKTLKIQPTELVELDKWYRRSKTAKSKASPNIYWHYVCRTMLDRQKKLSTNEVIASEAMQFDLLDDEIFISLALVERKEPERLSQNVHPARPIEQYEEKPPLEYEQFRKQVLRQGKSDRIAIIGEPGAGKTTLLQHIAFWILDKELGLPIWISLGDLIKNGDLQRLKDYLTQVWLDDAVLNVTQDVRADFLKQLNEQRVWLLLDGADEIVASSGIALREINNQLRGWLSQSCIILTCRINVWEVDINALRDFQTYRTKEFHYPTQVERFIESGFRKSNQQSGKRLKTELASTERTRLQQLVRNPLRLMMLCTTWHEQESLPATKAELYKRFVSEFYKWNRSKWKKKDLNYAFFPNTVAKEEKLNKALGRLACRALDEESSPFRLPHNLVSEELGDPDEGGSDFWLALNLGWLQVARDSDKPSDKVYTFFHPTFQEYFAALVINECQFFLKHTPHNPVDGIYRILESQWKEIFLLWLGRENISQNNKTDLIVGLIEFKDTCNGLYQYQTYCLAASGLSEFVECSFANSILEQLIYWHFGYFSFTLENKKWILFLNPNPIGNLVELTLIETNRDVLIEALIAFTTKSSNHSICRDAARSLGRFGCNNHKAIQALIYLVQNSSDKQVRKQAVESLGEIGSKAPEVLNVLNYHLFNSQDKEEQLQTAKSLGKINPGNSNAIDVLVEALLISEDSFASKQIGWSLREIDINHESVGKIAKLLLTTKNERERQLINQKLNYIDPTNSEATNDLRRILRANCDDNTKLGAAISLLEINSQDSDAISTLIDLLKKSQDIEIKEQIIGSLGMVASDSLDAIDTLSNLLHSGQDETILILASEMLRHIGFGNKKAILSLIQLIQASQDSELQYHYAECLGEIDPGNPEVISTFVKLLDIEDDDESKIYAIDRLSKIGLDSQIIKNKFFNLLNSSQGQRVCLEVAWNVWLHSACNLDVTYTLLSDHFFHSKDEKSFYLAAWRLKNLLQGNLFCTTVSQIAKTLPMTACEKDISFHKIYFDVALFCVQKMSYLSFYRAWHNELKALP